MRKSGVLLPIFSLPSRWGVGDFGREGVRFAKFLNRAGLRIWQILPTTPTEEVMGNSPYSPNSVFAGNFLFISPDGLTADGFLDKDDVKDAPDFPTDKVDYPAVRAYKTKLLKKAYERFKRGGKTDEYWKFFEANRYWLESWSFFATLRALNGGKPWYEWEDGLKFRTHEALHAAWVEHEDAIEYERFVQFVFFKQAADFRAALALNDVELIGDIPIYTTRDSSDVWSNTRLFDLDEGLEPLSVAGVPPDYFSKTGQYWGNPLYKWDVMENENFEWWLSRLHHALATVDMLRIDHFRGLIAYWAINAAEKTAVNGEWRNVPYQRLFARMRDEFPGRPFLAENLGVITDDVTAVMKEMELPGMLVLHFAWDDPAHNAYAPHNHTRDNVVYTGTHDNNTTRGWFRSDITEEARKNLEMYTGRKLDSGNIAPELIRIAMSSVAERAVIPLQDFLGLDGSARVNRPSSPKGNWEWRLEPGLLTDELADMISDYVEIYGRNDT